MVTKQEIMDKLGEVKDPEIGINIVEMGLIYEVKVEKKKAGKPQKAYIKMTFTTPACPLINVMLSQVKEKLEEFKDLDVELSVVFEPLWNPEMMSDKAKTKLGII